MKKNLFKTIVFFAFLTVISPLNAEPCIESTSEINWITRTFTSRLSLDTKKAELKMPSGKKKASALINTKMSQLIQSPLLALYTDSSSTLEDCVIEEKLTLDDVYDFITHGYKTPDIFTNNAAFLNTTNALKVDNLGKFLVKHDYGYIPEEQIDIVPSRPYSGIIIDARGKLPVHGEFVKDSTSACFFPVIWDEKMNVIYERTAANSQVIFEKGLVSYDYSDSMERYYDRIGSDPLYIKANEVFGINRTDPVISRKDALKILTVPENVQLLNDGKVVILLDKENLVYDIAVPEKDKTYYTKYEAIKQYFYQNMIPDVDISDTKDGILFAINLNFYPDSPQLLPSEAERIDSVAEQIKRLLINDGYTILVEGHTADVGKPVGQLNLSIERAQTVMDALIAYGMDSSIFTYKGYGGTMPIDTNETEEGRAQNRRVYITARPRATYIQRDW